jgi:hypothetical protein
MIELLERLSITPTDVPGFAFAGGHDAVFGFLAWPYIDSAKVLSEEISAHGEGLPPRAAAAVAALIAEEHIMNGTLNFSGAQEAAISGAEAMRALRLREVSGAEGAIAGSTTAIRQRNGDGHATSPEASAVHVAESRTPTAAMGPAVAPMAASVVPPIAAAGAAAPLRIERISVNCPACHAGNSPANRRCIACGERMPASS